MTKRNWLLLALCALLVCTCALLASCNFDFGNIGGEGGGTIGGGGGNTGDIVQDEYYIVDVQMVTPPTISDYGEGDVFDPTGMVLKVIWNDGWEQLVPDGKNCIFSPAGPITAETEAITAIYDDKTFTLPVTVNKITDIKVVSQPARTLYAEGEAFSAVGLKIVSVLENGEDGKVITDYTLSENAAALSPSDEKVTITYKRGANTYTHDIPVTVVSKDAVVVIEAENGTVTKGEKVTKSSLLQYASGNSFVRNLKEGGTIVINIPSVKATTASIRFVASSYEDALNAEGNLLDYTMPLKINEYLTVSFNGQTIAIGDDAVLPGGYDDDRGNLSRYCHWYEISLDDVQLNAGDNYLVITSLVDMSKNNTKEPENAELNDYHSTLFDCLRVFYGDADAVPKDEEPPVVNPDGETLTEKTYQAEDLTLNGITTVVKAKGDNSGLFNTMIANGDNAPGFIKNFTAGSTLTLKLNLAAATKVKISIYGSSTLGSDVTAAALIKGVTLNGTAITPNSGICFPKNDRSVAAMATFLEYVLGELDFVKGENTLVITFNATEACFIDRLVLADAVLAACTHENKTAVGEAKDATCTATGLTAGVKCADCDKVLEEQKVIEKAEHTPAEAVKKNEIKPTCTEPGSYDMVVYCSVCKTYEISKTSHTVQPTDHSYTDENDASCNNEGCDYERVVNCDHTYDAGVVTTRPTPMAEGVKTFTCTKCGDSYTEAVAKVLEAIYEVESGVVDGGSVVPDGKSGLTKFMSGKGFVRDLKLGATITITVVMDEATVGSFRLVMSSHEDNGGALASTTPVIVKEAITVSINGVNYVIGDDVILPGGPNYDFNGDGTVDNLTKHCHFYDLVIEDVELKKGENTFVITSLVDMSNKDYMADLHSTIFDVLKVWYNDVPHTHSASDEWEYNETHHWHDCVANDGQEYDKAEHSFDNACDTTCDCGYERTVSHDFTGDWQKDAEGHWHVCKTDGCDVTDTKADHAFGEWNETKGATETEAGSKERSCSACGYKETAEIPALGHTHNPSGEWEYNETYHWHDCVSNDGQEYNKAEHIFDNACDTTCECGYVRTVPHDFTGDWSYDADGHWHICKTEGCDVTDTKENHSYTNDCDTDCDCGYTREIEHAWNDGEVTENPTPTKEGVRTFTCSVCGATKTENVAKLTEVIIEAENTILSKAELASSGGVVKYTSGSKFVRNLKEGGTITFRVFSTKSTAVTFRLVMASHEDALDAEGNKLTSTMDLRPCEYLALTLNGQEITIPSDFVLKGGSDYDFNGDGATDNVSRYAHFYELVLENVELNEGVNTFVITSIVDMSNDNAEDLHSTLFDCLKVWYNDESEIPAPLTETKTEAENAKLAGFTTAGTHGTAPTQQAAHFSNGTFIKNATSGATVTLTVDSTTACKVKLTMTGVSTSNANLAVGKLLKNVKINGTTVTTYTSANTETCFTANGGAYTPDKHSIYSFGEFDLAVGTNTIVITFNASEGAFIDYFTVTPIEE